MGTSMQKTRNGPPVWTLWQMTRVLWIGQPLDCAVNSLLRLSVLTERDGEEQTHHMPENASSFSYPKLKGRSVNETHVTPRHPPTHYLHMHMEFECVSIVAGHMSSKVQ